MLVRQRLDRTCGWNRRALARDERYASGQCLTRRILPRRSSASSPPCPDINEMNQHRLDEQRFRTFPRAGHWPAVLPFRIVSHAGRASIDHGTSVSSKQCDAPVTVSEEDSIVRSLSGLVNKERTSANSNRSAPSDARLPVRRAQTPTLSNVGVY